MLAMLLDGGRNGFWMSLVLAALFMLVALSSLSAGSAPVMDDDNKTGHLHCENEEGDQGTTWWNTDPQDDESGAYNHQSVYSVEGGDWAYDFAVRTGPNSAQSELEQDIIFEPTDAYVMGQVHLEFQAGEPSEVEFLLDEEGTVHGSQTIPYESDSTYEINFAITDDTTAQQDHDLELQIRWARATGDNEWTIYLDDTTYVSLPIANDTDDDGIPDFRDEDDDNDGYTDEEEEEAGSDPQDPDSCPGEPVDDPPGDTNDTNATGDDDDDSPAFTVMPVLVVTVSVAIIHRRRTRR